MRELVFALEGAAPRQYLARSHVTAIHEKGDAGCEDDRLATPGSGDAAEFLAGTHDGVALPRVRRLLAGLPAHLADGRQEACYTAPMPLSSYRNSPALREPHNRSKFNVALGIEAQGFCVIR